MKKILGSLAIAALIAAEGIQASPSLAQVGPGNMGGTVNTGGAYICTRDANGGLNIRSGAGQQYKVVTQARNNGVVQVLDSIKGSDGYLWQKVYYGEATGWVRADFLCSGMGGEGPKIAYVCTEGANGSLNLRTGAGEQHKKIVQVANGRTVQPIDSDRGSDGLIWQKVYYGNTIGWVRGDYLCSGYYD
jgi:uncharacterized protein YgiM (DUF1202 family)